MSRNKISDVTKRMGVSFSNKIKFERERLAMSQSKLSDLSKVPLDTLRSIENGRIYTPNVFIADSLVKALKGNLDKWMKEIRGEHGL